MIKTTLALAAAVLGIALPVSPAFADQALATSRNCMACHAVDRKVLGPAFRDVALKYKDDKGAADRLAGKIQKGSTGAWGAMPMPPNTQVSEAEARKLAAWVLSQR